MIDDRVLYLISLIALMVSAIVAVVGCLIGDALVFVLGLVGFAVNGYDLIVVPRLRNKE